MNVKVWEQKTYAPRPPVPLDEAAEHIAKAKNVPAENIRVLLERGHVMKCGGLHYHLDRNQQPENAR